MPGSIHPSFHLSSALQVNISLWVMFYLHVIHMGSGSNKSWLWLFWVDGSCRTASQTSMVRLVSHAFATLHLAAKQLLYEVDARESGIWVCFWMLDAFKALHTMFSQDTSPYFSAVFSLCTGLK